MKLCINCSHYTESRMCDREISPVDGKAFGDPLFFRQEVSKCGPDAQWFEQAVVQPRSGSWIPTEPDPSVWDALFGKMK